MDALPFGCMQATVLLGDALARAQAFGACACRKLDGAASLDGAQTVTCMLEIPDDCVGKIMGTKCKTLYRIRDNSQAHVDVSLRYDNGERTRLVRIVGAPSSVDVACIMVAQLVSVALHA